MQSVGVFCGSSSGRRPEYLTIAADLARMLVKQGVTIVYGGGGAGVMGALSDAAVAAGGRIVGVIPRDLVQRDMVHDGLSDLRVVASMHERKALMMDLAEAFIALPGGYGTLEELFEVLCWAQLGLHDKPSGILNTSGYFDALVGFLDAAEAEGFLRRRNRGLLMVEEDPARLLVRLSACVVAGGKV